MTHEETFDRKQIKATAFIAKTDFSAPLLFISALHALRATAELYQPLLAMAIDKCTFLGIFNRFDVELSRGKR